MHIWKKSLAAIAASSFIATCYGEDFTGAYRLQGSNAQKAFVLNIHAKQAELFQIEGKQARIKPLAKMNVSVNNGKLFLDDIKGDDRLALKRNVDERSLDCLNCSALSLPAGTIWNFDSKGPYALDRMLKEQAAKDDVALNVQMQAYSEQIMAQAQRETEAAKLGPFEGEWVYQRINSHDPLSIMTIWRKSQIKKWSFNFQTLDRLTQGTPKFEITQAGLKIEIGPRFYLYALSADKRTLTCVDCPTTQRWVKSDPKKDLSDRNYARSMAGRP